MPQSDIYIYNTLSRKKEIFKPIKDKEVRIYTCGPTVYDYPHIGNMRAFLFADTLKRMFLFNGYKVKHVMNITDVGHLTDDADAGEDKIEKKAKKEGKTAWEISKYYTDIFLRQLEDLNIIKPDIMPKATETIEDQIKLIQILEEKGYTYKTSDGIYFDTSKLDDYGKLARLDIKGLEAGARIEHNQEKKNITDFALWKFSAPNGDDPAKHPDIPRRQMEWPSPWGVGFPGWHIECSVMSTKHLGQPFDIHTGGIDHIPVHHTNEIAQSEAAYGKPLANYWMHNEFLIIDNTKMAKSLGNFYTLEDVIKQGFTPLAYRYLCLSAHYRSKLNFTLSSLKSAQNSLSNIYQKVQEIRQTGPATSTQKEKLENLKKEFIQAINNDLDTPKAMSVFWETLKVPSKDTLAYVLDMDKVFGLEIEKNSFIDIPQDIQKLIDLREKARKEKDFQTADELREKIEKTGYSIEDTPSGPIVIKKNIH